MADDPTAPKAGTETVSLGDLRLSPHGELPAGHVVDGRYEVQSLLGRGGYGLVYEAVDRRSGRMVALKVLRADRWSEAAVGRFRREAELVEHLRHPRLARVYETGTDGGDLYLTMERVWGESLACRLRRGPLPVDEAVEIALQIAEALEALHGAGLVHRDVKPANVLLDARGWVKLADFGLIRCTGDEAPGVPARGEAMGTAEYMAPEEALGEPLGAQSDLYSLGVVLFEMLTGELPHLGRTPVGTLLAHLQQVAPDVRGSRAEVPLWLARATARLLARRPEERYHSARELRQDLLARGRAASAGFARLRRVASLGTVLALAACALAVQEVRPGNALREVVHGPGGLMGVGPGGEVLWRRPGWSGDLARARLKPGEPERLVGVVASAGGCGDGTVRHLTVLDQATGGVVRSVELVDGSREFTGFSDCYGARVAAVDLDGDGLDEVVVSYTHVPYWPSYVVLYEPLLERSRVVFYGSGHHRYAGAADVDGDGRPELVLAGINNRLGYVSAVAAVRIVPGVNRPAGPANLPAASSPDSLYVSSQQALAWYVLAPRRAGGYLGSVFSADPESRTLWVRGAAAEPLALSFDGFVAGSASTLAPAARRAARAEGYVRLREARRLAAAGFPRDALDEIGRAVGAARRVNDPVFEEHALRVRGQILVAAGRFEAADTLFSEVAAGSLGVPEVAFDAGRAFHLAGQLERAVRWYRRGLGPGGTSQFGRGKYEFLEGLVFSLEELGRPEEAAAEIERFDSSWAAEKEGEARETVALFRDYLRWRAGDPPSRAWGPAEADHPDILRYLMLEMSHASGGEPGEVLAAVDDELGRASETVPALRSLRSVLLRRLGRTQEAAVAARHAVEEIGHRVDDEVYGRVFRGLVEARATDARRGTWERAAAGS